MAGLSAFTLVVGATAIAAIAIAVDLPAAAQASAVSWLTYGFSGGRTGYNGAEKTLGPTSVLHLRRRWSVYLGGAMIAQPVEAAAVKVGRGTTNVVYEGTERGHFYALRARDGHLLWQRNLGSVTTACPNLPGGAYGIGGAGAISFTAPGVGVVYVAGGDGAVHALNLATGAETRGWPVRNVFAPAHDHVYGGLTLFAGQLYVTTASHCDFAPYHGAVVDIDVTRHAVAHRFYPAGPPGSGVSGGGIWGPGGVSVDPFTRDVLVTTGNALTAPENYLDSEAAVDLSTSLHVRSVRRPALTGNDADFGSTPIVFQPRGCSTPLVAAKNKTGVLFVYSLHNHRLKPTQRLQIADVDDWRFNGMPAWDPVTNMLYIANSSDSKLGDYEHGMVALRGSGCRLAPAWERAAGAKDTSVSSPTVADGVVYYGDGPGNVLFAFNAATGRPLWNSGSAIGGYIYAAPAVVNGMVFVASWDHYLHAFGL